MATLPDYSINVAQPFTEALKGYQLGMGFEAAKQQNIMQQQQAQQALRQQQALQDAQRLVFQNPNAENYSRLMTLDPKSSEAYQRAWSTRNAQQQDTLAADLLKKGAAITSGKPEIAAQYLEDKATAIETQNNGQPTPESQAVRTQARIMKEHPDFALGQIQALLAVNPLGKQASETLAKFGAESRSATEAPAKLRQELAAADKAEAEARVKMETATDDIAKAKATRQFEEAKARKEKVQADTELQTRLSDIGFKQAQINKFKVETRNLDTQGKMLSLDFQAALQGLPLPSKKTEGGGGAATEDERKAAGWLAQATNAYNNMLGAMYTKEGKTTGAEKPGVIESALGTLPFIGEGSAALARGTDRQKFTQAASSLSEALLRAATGAGVNRDEAKQKLEELTPLFTDDADTRKQKLEAIPVYLESLKARAGRAAPSGYQVPQAPTNPLSITLPDGTVFTAPNQKALDEFKRRAGL